MNRPGPNSQPQETKVLGEELVFDKAGGRRSRAVLPKIGPAPEPTYCTTKVSEVDAVAEFAVAFTVRV